MSVRNEFCPTSSSLGFIKHCFRRWRDGLTELSTAALQRRHMSALGLRPYVEAAFGGGIQSVVYFQCLI